MREKKYCQEQINYLREKAQLLNEKVLSGEISINKAREEFGLPPKEGCSEPITKG